VEGDIGNAAGLGGGEIGAAGIAAIGGGLPRRRPEVDHYLPVAKLSLCRTEPDDRP